MVEGGSDNSGKTRRKTIFKVSEQNLKLLFITRAPLFLCHACSQLPLSTVFLQEHSLLWEETAVSGSYQHCSSAWRAGRGTVPGKKSLAWALERINMMEVDGNPNGISKWKKAFLFYASSRPIQHFPISAASQAHNKWSFSELKAFFFEMCFFILRCVVWAFG